MVGDMVSDDIRRSGKLSDAETELSLFTTLSDPNGGADRKVFFTQHAWEQSKEYPNRCGVEDSWIALRVQRAVEKIVIEHDDRPMPNPVRPAVYDKSYFVVVTTPYDHGDGDRRYVGFSLIWQSPLNNKDVRRITKKNFGLLESFIAHRERKGLVASSRDHRDIAIAFPEFMSTMYGTEVATIISKLMLSVILEYDGFTNIGTVLHPIGYTAAVCLYPPENTFDLQDFIAEVIIVD